MGNLTSAQNVAQEAIKKLGKIVCFYYYMNKCLPQAYLAIGTVKFNMLLNWLWLNYTIIIDSHLSIVMLERFF